MLSATCSRSTYTKNQTINHFQKSCFRKLSYTPTDRSSSGGGSSLPRKFVPNPNGPNVQIVRKLTEELDALNNGETGSQAQTQSFKQLALQRARNILNAYSRPVTTGEDVKKIIGCGEGVARRIDEILGSGKAKDISSAPQTSSHSAEPVRSEVSNERDRVIAIFRQVRGIGDVQAARLYKDGCRTLDDLRKLEYYKTLKASVRVSLDYVGHLDKGVTRQESEAVMGILRSTLSHDIRAYVVGSYRRGQPSSSYIDVIMFHPLCIHVPSPGERVQKYNGVNRTQIQARGRTKKVVTPSQMKNDMLLRDHILVPLERAGIIAATLTEGTKNWQGIVRVPNEQGQVRSSNVYRRMEIKLYPCLSEGAALIANTGDSHFLVYVRNSASALGLYFNEFGLWHFQPSAISQAASLIQDPVTDSGDNDQSEPVVGMNKAEIKARRDAGIDLREDGRWALVASQSEKDVLKELGIGFAEPEQRKLNIMLNRMGSNELSLLKKE